MDEKPVEKQKFSDPCRISVDFDGVLNLGGSYSSRQIPPIRPGSRQFLEKLRKDKFEVVVHTARKDHSQVKDWLRKNGMSQYVNDVSNVKLPSLVYVDDRAIRFSDNFDSTLRKIRKLYRAEFGGTDTPEKEQPTEPEKS